MTLTIYDRDTRLAHPTPDLGVRKPTPVDGAAIA